jgi:hypothetical protein
MDERNLLDESAIRERVAEVGEESSSREQTEQRDCRLSRSSKNGYRVVLGLLPARRN